MTQPHWCLSPSEMAAVDRAAIDAGLPGAALMESAGRGVAAGIVDRFGDRGSARILVGKGNNGGDGLVAARVLAECGWGVELVLCTDPEQLDGDAGLQWGLVGPMQLPIVRIAGVEPARLLFDRWDGTCVVDALLGTGLEGDVREPLRSVIEALNRADQTVFAVDTPSGIDGGTGEVRGVAVRADHTITFGFPKRGLLLAEGPRHVGRLSLVPLAYPPRALDAAGERPIEWTGLDVARAALPPIPPNAHKGSRGRVLIVAGSTAYRGAAILSATAALRSGVGMTVVAAPASIAEFVVGHLPEALVAPLPEMKSGGLSATAARRVAELAGEADAIAIGPGLTTAKGVAGIVKAVLESRTPVVVDADALNALAVDPVGVIREPPTILTPHPGELARWLGRTSADVDVSRVRTAIEAAGRWGAHVVLKGSPTVIADPSGGASLNLTGNPALATGGSGDVLTGLLGGLMAQGVDAAVAARAAPLMHGLAADWGAHDLGSRGFAPSDLFRYLPLVFREITADRGAALVSRLDHRYADLLVR